MDLSNEGILGKNRSRMQEFRRARTKINRELTILTNRRPPLGDGAREISAILGKYLGPEFSGIPDGIYCGMEGCVWECIPGFPSTLVMDWYNGRLEVAYLS